MADNSGIPSKQMKIWIANRRAQIKTIREENARLRIENEMLREENREMSLMQRKKVCGLCVLKAENARLRAEFERLQAIAAMRQNIANPKEELGSSSSAFQTPAPSSATGSQPDPGPGAYVPKDEPPSM
ncbi:homeobox-leucine zipper protein TF1 [Setaria viridis]|uniref:homeobox-leucine zipper protein TF1 n=1 Tax=Setaria viridis TaxID=4556 RepID=UPI003B3AE327